MLGADIKISMYQLQILEIVKLFFAVEKIMNASSVPPDVNMDEVSNGTIYAYIK